MQSGSMTVVLNARTEAIVAEHLKKGHYHTPDEVVNALLEAGEEDRGLSFKEAQAELLSSLGKPFRPYRKGQFAEMVSRDGDGSRAV